MKKDNLIFLQHILECIEKIEEFTNKISEDDFMKLVQTQDAVVRRLEIIGEATKNLSNHFRGKHRNIPWNQMARMRDKLIHGYFGVDLMTVWEVVEDDLPNLKKKIRKLLEDSNAF
ncbi:MAG TPA: DUF86 domain-containing protein [Candidatus Omnitrophota bacterium]|nr:DUF86 domain-containing protein [Candidatus Omnitrophota bacterium]